MLDATQLLINELGAINDNTLVDEEGDSVDWIEIHNPSTADIELAGFYLTDDPDELTQWQFPTATIEAGGFELVFASDKNPAPGPLHTNFKLRGRGEYLALVMPDGVTVIHQYAPQFPRQFEDISYGLSQEVTTLVEPGAPISFSVPTAADAPLGTDWTEVDFDDSAWTSTSATANSAIVITEVNTGDGNSNPDYAEIQNVSDQTVDTSGWFLVANDTQGGNMNLAHGQAGNDGTVWSLPSSIAPGEILFRTDRSSDAPNYWGGNLYWAEGGDGWVMIVDETGNVVDFVGWGYSAGELASLNVNINGFNIMPGDQWSGGGASYINPASNSYQRRGDSDDNTRFDWQRGSRTLGEQNSDLTTPFMAGIGFNTNAEGFAVTTDVKDLMLGVNASLWTRIPFQVDDTEGIELLTLRMQYNDGLVAYLNGEEIADRNAPANPTWDGQATDARSAEASTSFENINISTAIEHLQLGDNVLAIHGMNVAAGDADFLILAEIVASSGQGVERYFTTPSPGAANVSGVVAFVGDTAFSVDRGFFETAFDVIISTPTEDAAIRYTLDGSTPTETNGSDYSGPFTIDSTTVLRAAAFKSGFEPSNVDTQTYFFLDDVIGQTRNSGIAAGFPSSNVNGQSLDYGMATDIVNSGTWGPQMVDALRAVPSISIVTDVDNLFGSSQGIYVNAGGHGASWERPVSLELIDPDGGDGFQLNAGLRIRGGFSRQDGNPKHAFRLFFRDEYGAGKLNFPLFGDEGTDRYDKFDLRTTQNYSWSFGGDSRNVFLRDVFSRDVQRAMGQPYTRSRFYHLYLNGQYWGLYQSQERSEASFAAEHFGGERDDYDVVKSSGSSGSPSYASEATDGNLDAYRRLYNMAIGGFQSDATYYRAQGMNVDGTRNPDFERLLDVDNLIDYMVITYFTADRDGPASRFLTGRVNNYFGIYNRVNPDGFKFFEHDSEHSLDSSSSQNMVSPFSSGGNNFTYFNPHWLHERLARDNDDYLQRFNDRVYKHLFNDGPLAPDNAISLLDSRAAEIEMAIIAESARWGDAKRGSSYTKSTWQGAVTTTRNWLSASRGRVNTVLGQLRNVNWYNNLVPPTLLINGTPQFGGDVFPGAQLSLTGSGGVIYVTLDGSDPRLSGGGVNPDALGYNAEDIALLGSTRVMARLRSGTTWSPLAEADFLTNDVAPLRITEIMYNPADTSGSSVLDQDGNNFEFVEVRNVGGEEIDLKGAYFTGFDFSFDDGATLGARQYMVIVKDQAAFQARYPDVDANLIAGEYFTSNLDNAGELISLVDMFGRTIVEVDFKDGWYDVTDGDGYSLTIRDASAHPSTWSEKTSWRPSSDLNGSPGEADSGRIPDPDSVVINEALTHTDLSVTGDWIELHNTTDEEINIGGWYLSDSGDNLRKFRISEGTVIPGGSFLTFDQFVFDQVGFGGFGVNSLGVDPLGNPGAFGLSELGDTLRLSSFDPTLVRENIDAVHVLDDGRLILSTATSAVLGNNVLSFRNGDLVEYDPKTDTASLIFSESIFVDVVTGLVRSGENVDAVSQLSGGDLVISTAGQARIGDLVFGDGDLVRYDPNSGLATLLLSEEIFSGGSNIDAVHLVETNGQITRLILSTDGPSTISGVLYDDGDLIEIIPGTGANLATAQLGTGAIVSRYLAESVFEVGGVADDPTENIDAVFIDPDENIVLSTASGAALIDVGAAFQNGDLVQLTGGGNDLGSGTIDEGATLQLLFEEDPAAGRTFYSDVGSYREEVDFGAADPEVTFGRYTTSQGTTDFVAQEESTKNTANGALRIGPVVINEIMYNPLDGTSSDDGVEYIELLNITGSVVSLTDWRFTGGVEFFFPADATLAATPAAGAFALVLPRPTSGFGSFAAFAADFRNTNSVHPDVTIYGPYVGALSNGGEDVELSRPGKVELDGIFPDVLIDRVDYDNSSPWPVEPDGSGPSLARFASTAYGNDVVNWLPSGPAGSNSGTPGRENITFDVSPPSAPEGIRTSVISDSQIDVSWQPATDPHSGILGYKVYRDGELIGQTQALSTSFSDFVDVVGSTIYTYQITALNGSRVEGPKSLPAFAAVLTLTSTAVPSVTQVRVGFSERLDEASAEVTSKYQISGPTNVTVLSAQLDSQDPSGSTVILTTTQLEEQTDYQLTVTGVVALGGNTMSQTPQVIGLHVADGTPPTAPANLSARLSASGQLELSWTPAVDLESAVGRYLIFRDGIQIGSSTTNSFVDVAVSFDSDRSYTVSAENIDAVVGEHSAPLELSVTGFQQGSLPGPTYNGSVDSELNEEFFDTNFANDIVLKADLDVGQGGFQEWTLLKWDVLSIDPGTEVLEASFTINVSNTSPEPYFLYRVLLPWVEDQVTWNQAADGLPWEIAGAKGADDVGTTILGTVLFTSQGRHTAELNADGIALLQSWIDGEKDNHGLMLFSATNDDSLQFASSEAADASTRPKLSLSFVTSDNQSPQVIEASVNGDPAVREIVVRFDENVQVEVESLVLRSDLSGEVISPDDMALAYDAQTQTAVWTFPALPGGQLPAGDYTATLASAEVTDTSGNPLDGNRDGAGGDNFVMQLTSGGGPAADLTGNGFVDFEDLTVLLAHWNQNVSAAEGNLVNPVGTPVNFEDLTVLLAAWTGPGPAASPQPAAAEAIVRRDTGTTDTQAATTAHFDRLGRRDHASLRRANRTSILSSHDMPLRRLQAAAVDRAMDEQSTPERAGIMSRRTRRIARA